MGQPAEEAMEMDEDVIYKGYTIKHIGAERMINAIGSSVKIKTYYISDRTGRGVAKAWGLTEARALVNADIRGEL